MKFANGAVVITGAAGEIGMATARLLAHEGVPLVVVDRDKASVDRAVGVLGRGGTFVQGVVLDVSNSEDVNALASRLAGTMEIQGIANVAGIYQPGTIDTVSEAEWDGILEVNLKGTFLMCQAFMPILSRRSTSAIVNVGALSGRTKSFTASPAYASSKAGIIGLTMSLAAQNGHDGVRVNCVAPGRVYSAMFENIPPEQRANPAEGVPLRRAARAAEIADAIGFLLSEHASYITGETLNVNGGLFTV